ncbi:MULTISPECIES: ATP phosphoribosyltransferase [unclassified Archaeoglobus]|jgi:ATP phosphoribosyltransferase|uniref:ATP phosphoribosyltransferase n=1 Tax=unclassified Archaeoglobus TaxID=2643606 RepID=UPI0025BF1CD1|nr:MULTISPECIES: ATP phosphoribosyltransferase [unclassified Archaeoglobus]
MNERVKVYFPDGHLEKPIWDALTTAGYRLSKSERGYLIDVDHPNLIFKQVRPQIMPFYIEMGKGDGGITGEDILENWVLKSDLQNVEVLEELPLRPTKLVAAISEEIYPNVKTIEDFKAEVGDKRVFIASEFPEIARRYAEKHELNAIVFDPIGKTEASLLPPMPEADLIIEVTEFGTTLKENMCRIIDVVMEKVHSVFIVNRDSIKEEEKRRVMENLVTDLREVIESRNLVSLYFNVPDEEDLKRIIGYLTDRGFDPTISPLAKGGAAVHIIIDRSQVKFLKPIMRDMGAKRIATSPVITFGD